MYFAALKRAIQALEEKRFYDIALMYLENRGYRDLSIVDGSGDGGRDVICSRGDLRIQLSVRKDWMVKVNDESRKTKEAGKHHLIYITNRQISTVDEEAFRTSGQKYAGVVDVVIHDLNRISTALAQPGVIEKAYAALGMSVDSRIQASEKDIALSAVMLFSREAQDFRENIVESNVRAWIFKNGKTTFDHTLANVSSLLPFPEVERDVSRAINRLRASGRIVETGGGIDLSAAEKEIARAAEDEFLHATSADIKLLEEKYGLVAEDAKDLLQLALELTIRDRSFEDRSAHADALIAFVSERGLSCRKVDLYEDLSRTTTARAKQYGRTLERIFDTSTFDIYRALGRRTSISMLLDSSVAMPMLCGLAFGSVRSRFGVAAMALRRLCEQHDIQIEVPSFYVNEMASHGIKALEFIETYEQLPDEVRALLTGSRNAYLSHYSTIREKMVAVGDEPPILDEFLGYFGFVRNAKLGAVENKISSLLDKFGIRTVQAKKIDFEIRRQIQQEKVGDDRRIIDHDAMLITLLKEQDESGFVFATWDNVLIRLIAETERIYADTPARVIDFLSMAASAKYECDQSVELLTSLIHCDSSKAEALAQLVERIESTEQAYRLQKFIEDARRRAGPGWELTDTELKVFFQQDMHSAAG